jgi:hypothetical protein
VLDPAAAPLLVQAAADPVGGLLQHRTPPAKAAYLRVRRARGAVTRAGWHYNHGRVLAQHTPDQGPSPAEVSWPIRSRPP